MKPLLIGLYREYPRGGGGVSKNNNAMGRFFFFQKATNNLDKDTCGEILDNRWLKKEVHLTAGLNGKHRVGTKLKFETERSTDVVF